MDMSTRTSEPKTTRHIVSMQATRMQGLYSAKMGSGSNEASLVKMADEKQAGGAKTDTKAGKGKRGKSGEGEPRHPTQTQHDVKCNERIPKMRVKMFGGLRVSVAGVEIPESAWSKNKAKLFFAHVVSRFGREVSREMLIESLWPNMDRARAVDNVYVTWSIVRRVVEDESGALPYLTASKSMYRINTDLVESDIYEFDVLARKMLFNALDQKSLSQQFTRMEQIYSGDLLAGLKCDPYLERLRRRYRDTYVDVLIAAANRLLGEGETPGALWFARKALNVETKREDVYQTLMLAQCAAGQRTSAMETYFMCKDALDAALGIPLSRKTVEIYERLLKGEM